MSSETIVQEVESGALAAILGVVVANESTVESWVASLENGGTNELATLLKLVPAVKGIAGIITGPLEAAAESALESYAASLVAKYPPATIVALFVGLIEHLQNVLGAVPGASVAAASAPLHSV